MSSFVIEGGYRLSGEIVPQGAKNEALEVICDIANTGEGDHTQCARYLGRE